MKWHFVAEYKYKPVQVTEAPLPCERYIICDSGYNRRLNARIQNIQYATEKLFRSDNICQNLWPKYGIQEIIQMKLSLSWLVEVFLLSLFHKFTTSF